MKRRRGLACIHTHRKGLNMNAVKAILILKHIGYAERNLEELFEGFEGLNMNITFPNMRLSYNGLKSFGKKRAVYMYCHGGSTVSLSPFSCPFDSGVVGWIWTNSDKLAQSVVKEIDEFLRDDLYEIYSSEDDFNNGDYAFVGSYAECLEYARENNAEMRQQGDN